MPERLVPMLPTLVEDAPAGDDWAFEVKWDGVRAISYSRKGSVRVESRNLLDVTRAYPEVVELGEALAAHDVVLDGEVVAFEADGRPSFERMQQRLGLSSARAVADRREAIPAVYIVFDLLYLDGLSAMGLPYQQRRGLLDELIPPGPSWRVAEYHAGDGPAMLAASRSQQLEGLVAKRLDSVYEPGRRTRTWLKIKNIARQEFVVGGFTPGEGNRAHSLGALLIGYYDGDQLRYAGKVGTGFTDKLLAELLGRLEPLAQPGSPFADGALPRGSTFVSPELVAEVAFTEWTSGGMIRHPAFKGLRSDKEPRSVVRELPVRVPR
jgi:bifunctional non-homologous end joining protein LigD